MEPKQLSLFDNIVEKMNSSPLAAENSEAVAEEPKKRSVAAEKRAERDRKAREVELRYYERKKVALGLEKKNFDKLIFVYGNGSDPWYKGFNHTAIFFENVIGPRIGSKIIAKDDKDFNKRVHANAVVSYRALDALTEKLLKIGCTIEDDRDQIYIFKLPERISEERYNLFLHQRQEAVDRANKILVPHLLAAPLYADMRILHRLVFNSVGRMSRHARETVGLEMENNARLLIKRYRKTAKRGGDALELYEEMLNIADDLDGDLAAITGLGVEDDLKVLEMAEKTEEIKQEILHEIKLIKLKEVDKTHGESLR